MQWWQILLIVVGAVAATVIFGLWIVSQAIGSVFSQAINSVVEPPATSPPDE